MRNQLVRASVGWLFFVTMAMASGPFVAPGEGPIPFRRDRLPLDVETMSSVSRHILLVSKTLKKESSVERRTAAQAIALSLALDPANREARDLCARLVAGENSEVPDSEEVASASSNLWKVLEWLESSESGLDAQKLGECLSDVISLTEPDHPKSKAHAGSGATGEWDGWIPSLASYDRQEMVKPPDAQPTEPTEPEEGKKPVFLRSEAVVSTPLWTSDKDSNKTVLKLVRFSMKADPEEPDEFSEDSKEFRFAVEGVEDEDSLKSACRPVLSALKKVDGRLPSSGRLSLSFGKGNDYLVHRNRLAVSAALAVLGDAAVSGREPSATVMGIVGDDGSLKLPTYAWDRLRALSDGPGGRLVLPRAAEALLPSILAVEDPGFFIKYEVVLADNLKELLEFSAKGGSGPLNDVSPRFEEIRARMGTQPVSQYVANRFVRQRLSEIAQACPDHLSARMLSIQGAGERPTRLPKNILAAEIRRAIQPVSLIAKDWDQPLDAAQTEEIFENCRKHLDPLERYVDIREREFFAEARALLTTVRTLGRAKRARVDNDDSDPHPAPQLYETLRAQYNKMRAELSELTGDEERKD